MGRFRFSSLSVKLQVLVWVAIIPVFWLVNSYENALASTKDVKQQGTRKFVIASSDNFPPVNMLDKDGNLTGFGRDLSTAVIRAIGGQTNYIHSLHGLKRLIILIQAGPILSMIQHMLKKGTSFLISAIQSLK